MPDTEVGIGLKSPPFSVFGFMSKVSLWLGPPSIQSRIQALCLLPLLAAWAAKTPSQPDRDVVSRPAVESLKKSRQERMPEASLFVMGGFLLQGKGEKETS